MKIIKFWLTNKILAFCFPSECLFYFMYVLKQSLYNCNLKAFFCASILKAWSVTKSMCLHFDQPDIDLEEGLHRA